MRPSQLSNNISQNLQSLLAWMLAKTLRVPSCSNVSVSVALFKEDENKKQRPLFFFNKSLADAKTRYNHLELAALALRVATKKLRPYFQAHPIVVLFDLPLRSTIHKLDLSERMAQWAIELSKFGIQYKPRLAKKR